MDQQKSLSQARQHTWLGEGSSSVQQAALRDLDRAFKNWWGNPGHFSRPSWRKKGIHEGFAIRDLRVEKLNRKWGQVQVPKLGWVKFRLSGRAFTNIAGCSSARVTLDRAGRWHISFTSPQPRMTRTRSGREVGLDMGITNTVTTSDREFIDLGDTLTPGETERRLRLERRLARQAPGSKRRARTRASLARLRTREADRRKDWIEKTTTRLVRDYDCIAIEDLKVKNMVATAKGTIDNPGTRVAAHSSTAREIHRQGWGLFRQRLQAKADAACDPNGEPRPVKVVAVPAAYTSQRCSTCGHTDARNRKNQAVFVCRACGYHDHADINAAINILAAGRAVTGRRAIPSRTSPTGETGNDASTNQQEVAA